MELLKNKHLWIGVAVGVLAYWAYTRYIADDSIDLPVGAPES